MPAWRFPGAWQTVMFGPKDELAAALRLGAVEVVLPRSSKGRRVVPLVVSPACDESMVGCGDDADRPSA